MSAPSSSPSLELSSIGGDSNKFSSSSSLLTSDGTGEAVSGFLGGFFSKLCDHPLDTIKTRMQTNNMMMSMTVSNTTATSSSCHSSLLHPNYQSNVSCCNATMSQFQIHAQRSIITKKVPQQQMENNTTNSMTARSCIRQIYQNDGIFGFYSGISSPLWGNALVKSLRFSIYGRVQNFMSSVYFSSPSSSSNVDKENLLLPLPLVALAGGIAGGGCCAVLTPLEVTKVRCQSNPHQYPGVMSCVYQSLFPTATPTAPSTANNTITTCPFLKGKQLCKNVKNNLYSGFTATFIKESIGYAWWFYVYEQTIRLMTKFRQTSHQNHHHHAPVTRDNLPFYYYILAGANSSFFFWTAFYPIDTVKTIMQSSSPLRKMIYDPSTGRRSFQNLNFLETTTELWRRDPRIFYRGIGVTLLRAVPSNGVTMFFYELTMKVWKDKVQMKTSTSSVTIMKQNEDSACDYSPQQEINQEEISAVVDFPPVK